MNASDKSKEVLAEAKAIIANGWIQDVWHGENGESCLYGALIDASRNADTLDAADGALSALRAQVSNMSLIAWNDTPGRTQEEVLELLDRAIKSLDKPSDKE